MKEKGSESVITDWREGEPDTLSSAELQSGPYAMEAMPSLVVHSTPDWVVKSWERAARERLAREAAAGDIATSVKS